MLKNVNKNVDSKNDCILIVNSPDFPPVKRPGEIIIEVIVTTNQIAVFYSSNCN